MPEGQEIVKPTERKIRTSNKPGIQELVDKERKAIKGNEELKGENLSEFTINQMARRTIASTLKERKRIEEQNHKDILTGIYNRAGFLENVQRELGKMEVDIKKGITRKAVLFFLDADELKKRNTEGGHAKGDELLRDIAEVISNASRTGMKKQIINSNDEEIQRDERALDICGRWGGDEFVIFVSNANIEDILPFWNKMNRLFNERPDPIRISAGVAEVNINNLYGSIDQADKAMLAAKDIGKQTGENTMIRYDQLNTAK